MVVSRDEKMAWKLSSLRQGVHRKKFIRMEGAGSTTQRDG
jgi:hypothetical protein